MRIGTAIALLLAVIFCTTAKAADLSGTWQGAIQQGTAQTQYALKITRTSKGGYQGSWYIGGPERSGSPKSGDTTSAIAMDGQNINFTLDQTLDNFTGTLSADGNAMSGTWLCCWGPQKPQALTLTRATTKTAWDVDPSPHKMSFVAVEKGVKLEVLDWGGSGPPLVFLAGQGNTAHVFDDFAPKFTGKHHVYGITRRGFGASSVPPPTDENYDADRLGDDVLAVMEALKIEKPILAGHSIAGEELSSIGTRHPEKVSALIRLDAAEDRAFYAPGTDTGAIDLVLLRRAFKNYLARPGDRASDAREDIEGIMALMPSVQKRMADLDASLKGVADGPWIPWSPQQQAVHAIFNGEHKYTGINLPTLAIVPVPPACGTGCDSPGAKAFAATVVAQTDAFEAGTPHVRVVRLPHAAHDVWRSNEADVEREMNAFMDGLR